MPEQPIRVMVVENNKEQCDVLEHLVRSQADMEWVGEAHHGLEALEMIAKASPDVVILDIIMPYLDGLGVLAKLNELGLPKRPKVIVLTAFEEETMIRKSARLGADYYLLKPFDAESLANRIRQVAGIDPLAGYTRKDKAREVLLGQAGQVGQAEHAGLAGHAGLGAAPASTPTTQSKTLEDRVVRFLYRMGVPTYFKGYLYLKEAVFMVTQDLTMLGAITKVLYPRIAEKFGTTALIVEAAIRYTIQKTWRQGNQEFINKVFGYAANLRGGRPPTNSFFIARVAEELRLGLIEEAT